MEYKPDMIDQRASGGAFLAEQLGGALDAHLISDFLTNLVPRRGKLSPLDCVTNCRNHNTNTSCEVCAPNGIGILFGGHHGFS